MKNKKQIKTENTFLKAREDISFDSIIQKIDPSISSYIDISFEIALILKKFKTINSLTQKELSSRFDKKESEISKWLSGTHNFTIKTIAKIEKLINKKVLYLENDIFFNVDSKIIAKSTNEIFLSNDRKFEFIEQSTLTFKNRDDNKISLIPNNKEYCIN